VLWDLCGYLRDAEAHLIIANVKQEAVESAARELDAHVGIREIHGECHETKSVFCYFG